MMRAINAGSKILSTFEKSLMIGGVSTVCATVLTDPRIVATGGSSKLCAVTVIFFAGVTEVETVTVVVFGLIDITVVRAAVTVGGELE
jgi:hypothetical protein